jgi:hypothetical protein
MSLPCTESTLDHTPHGHSSWGGGKEGEGGAQTLDLDYARLLGLLGSLVQRVPDAVWVLRCSVVSILGAGDLSGRGHGTCCFPRLDSVFRRAMQIQPETLRDSVSAAPRTNHI